MLAQMLSNVKKKVIFYLTWINTRKAVMVISELGTAKPGEQTTCCTDVEMFYKENGAAYVTRTRDPRITNAMLYQLS